MAARRPRSDRGVPRSRPTLCDQLRALPPVPPALEIPPSRQRSVQARASELGISIATRPLENGAMGVWRLDGLPWK